MRAQGGGWVRDGPDTTRASRVAAHSLIPRSRSVHSRGKEALRDALRREADLIRKSEVLKIYIGRTTRLRSRWSSGTSRHVFPGKIFVLPSQIDDSRADESDAIIFALRVTTRAVRDFRSSENHLVAACTERIARYRWVQFQFCYLPLGSSLRPKVRWGMIVGAMKEKDDRKGREREQDSTLDRRES